MSAAAADPGDLNAGGVSRRSLVVGAGFALTAAVGVAVTPRKHELTLGRLKVADIIPHQVGPWAIASNNDLIMPDTDQPNDVYDQVLTRTFVAAGLPSVMLLIAYGAAQSGLMKVHRPEVCYASSGFAIHDDQSSNVSLGAGPPITAKTFLGTREDRSEQVLYWTRISDNFPRDLTEQRLVMLKLGLFGVIADGVLVRFSTFGTDLNAGHTALVTFAQDLVTSVGPAGRALLVGKLRAGAVGGKGGA